MISTGDIMGDKCYILAQSRLLQGNGTAIIRIQLARTEGICNRHWGSSKNISYFRVFERKNSVEPSTELSGEVTSALANTHRKRTDQVDPKGSTSSGVCSSAPRTRQRSKAKESLLPETELRNGRRGVYRFRSDSLAQFLDDDLHSVEQESSARVRMP
jgi:hypothetical protein